jgi:hypothetical protein
MNWIIYYLIYKAITIILLIYFFSGSRKENTKKFIKKIWSGKMKIFNFWKRFQLNKKRENENRSRKVGLLIADFYLEKYKEEETIELQYKKAVEDIDSMRISRIEWNKEIITITLARPGLLIGRHGKNIEELEKFLKTKINFRSLHIQEENILWSIYPQLPEREFDFD